MHRWSAAGVIVAGLVSGLVSAVLLATPVRAAGASGLSVTVSPSRGLVDGQSVTIAGRGLQRSLHGDPQTWFVTECTAAVQGRMNPSTDTPHCDVTEAQALRVGRNGAFSARFHVEAGIVGDGYCGTPGHETCVLGIGTAGGLGTVVRISFKVPPLPAGATTTS